MVKRFTKFALPLACCYVLGLCKPVLARETDCFPDLPDPVVEFAGTEDYEANGELWTRFKLRVKNYFFFPQVFFEPAPDLSPCGLNSESSRAWVYIDSGVPPGPLYAFCGLRRARSLESLYFILPRGEPPPFSAYVLIDDRRCPYAYASEPVEIPGHAESPPPGGEWIGSRYFLDFRFKAQVATPEGTVLMSKENQCIPDTLCLSGALPGRTELMVRIVGPKPNGYLWPTVVKFSTSIIELWIEQISTGERRYYALDAAVPGSGELTGLFDRTGFRP